MNIAFPTVARAANRSWILVLVLLASPVLAGCMGSTRTVEDNEEAFAGAPSGLVLEMDWRYRPPNDRHDGSPYGVHLSFLEDPRTSLTVTWFTAGRDDVRPLVVWGGQTDQLHNEVPATSRKAFGVDATVHTATIQGLPPGGWLHYQACGTTGCSRTFDARTAPNTGTPIRFGLIADHGTTNEALNASGTLLALRPDLVVFAGDLSYANGQQHIWDDWFHMHEPLFARVPIMAAPGNHEYKDGLFYDAYRNRLALPNGGMWYGIDYGDARFTFLEFYHGTAGAGHVDTQMRFFRNELATTSDRKADGEVSFHFVVQHFPLYGNHHVRGDYRFNIDLQEEHLLRHGVDFLLVGHDHFYERSHPTVRGSPSMTGEVYVDPVGYIQVTSGGGGRPIGPSLTAEQQAAWTAANEGRHQIVEFLMTDGTVTGRTWATDGSWDLLDHFVVERTAALVDSLA